MLNTQISGKMKQYYMPQLKNKPDKKSEKKK